MRKTPAYLKGLAETRALCQWLLCPSRADRPRVRHRPSMNTT